MLNIESFQIFIISGKTLSQLSKKLQLLLGRIRIGMSFNSTRSMRCSWSWSGRLVAILVARQRRRRWRNMLALRSMSTTTTTKTKAGYSQEQHAKHEPFLALSSARTMMQETNIDNGSRLKGEAAEDAVLGMKMSTLQALSVSKMIIDSISCVYVHSLHESPGAKYRIDSSNIFHRFARAQWFEWIHSSCSSSSAPNSSN